MSMARHWFCPVYWLHPTSTWELGDTDPLYVQPSHHVEYDKLSQCLVDPILHIGRSAALDTWDFGCCPLDLSTHGGIHYCLWVFLLA